MPRPPSVRHPAPAAAVMCTVLLACTVLSACTDDSTTAPGPTTTAAGPNTSLRAPIVAESPDGASATVDKSPRSFDACAALPLGMARIALGLAADAAMTNIRSGEKCTWSDDNAPVRTVTLTQDVVRDPASFFAEHPDLVDLATGDQKAGGMHLAMEDVSSGVTITLLYSLATYVLSLPERPDNVQRMVSEMFGLG